MIINNWQEKIKGWREVFMVYEKDIAITLLIILTAAVSYGLGRLSKIESARAPVTITAATSTGVKLLEASANLSDTRLVASKKGTKYYFPWCGGSNNIKEENKIYFATEQAAITAGYSRAANCQAKP